MKLVLCAIIAYLLGSVCASIPLSKRCMGEDIRRKGSGNAGATNAARVFGLKAGLVTLALDMAKTVAAMLIGKALAGVTGEAISGAFCIIGHCFPLYFGFRGGKGVAASLGIAWMVFPLGAAITTAAAAVIGLVSRRISLCSLGGIAVFFVTTLIFRMPNRALVILTGLMLVIVYVRHKDNIRRLLHGEEKQIIN